MMNAADLSILILGGGTIGRGWAVAFGAAGAGVHILDPDPACADHLAGDWARALPVLTGMGAVGEHPTLPCHILGLDELSASPDFVQEALPERLELKRGMFAALETRIAADTPIASSTSGLACADMQAGMVHPERLVIGHPCNPPWLMPVVELLGSPATSSEAMDRAEATYQCLGKTVIRVRGERPGHLVNRLQAALWREVVHLALDGAASLAEIDRAITEGLGPRWAAIGPSAIFHLAGGAGGMGKFLDDLGGEVDRWWLSLGTPRLDATCRAALLADIAGDPVSWNIDALVARRDGLVPAVLALTKRHREENPAGEYQQYGGKPQ